MTGIGEHGALGRREPTDWRHVERFPLFQLSLAERPKGVPSAIGINWYTEFDRPTEGNDGRWRIAQDARLTSIRGGHCICVLPNRFREYPTWWKFYNQGHEGSCVGFGVSRMMTNINRSLYNARWLYQQAQLVDEWADTPPAEGTSVRAGLDVLRSVGNRRFNRGKLYEADISEGISANRWATSLQDWLNVLDRPSAYEVPFVNSWGIRFPHITWVPVEVIERLMNEGGEFSVVTDR